MSSIYKDCCTVWTGWLRRERQARWRGSGPLLGRVRGCRRLARSPPQVWISLQRNVTNITATTCSGDGGGVQEAQLVTRGQGAVSLDTRLNGVTIATQTLALD